MVVFDGCGVLRIQREASWGRGAGGRARWPRLDGVGRRVLALSLPRISKFTLHQCAGGGPWGVSWFPVGQGVFCSWWCPEGGHVAEDLLSASSLVPGDNLSFCIATPEGARPGKGSRDSGDTGDSW